MFTLLGDDPTLMKLRCVSKKTSTTWQMCKKLSALGSRLETAGWGGVNNPRTPLTRHLVFWIRDSEQPSFGTGTRGGWVDPTYLK